MTVQTMEEFSDLGVGTVVNVTSRALGEQQWTKGADGWAWNGAVVKDHNFLGAITAGGVRLVEQRQTLSPGDWIGSGTYQHFVVAVDPLPNGDLRTVRFERGAFRDLTDVASNVLLNPNVHRIETPEWADRVTGLADAYARAMVEVGNLQRREVVGEGQRAVPESLVTRLQNYADEAEDSALDEVLDGAGIGRTRSHDSWVTITGTTYFTLPAEEAVEYVNGNDIEIDAVAGRVSIDWSMSVTISREGTGCTCDEIGNSDVVDYLPDRYDDWSFEARCDD